MAHYGNGGKNRMPDQQSYSSGNVAARTEVNGRRTKQFVFHQYGQEEHYPNQQDNPYKRQIQKCQQGFSNALSNAYPGNVTSVEPVPHSSRNTVQMHRDTQHYPDGKTSQARGLTNFVTEKTSLNLLNKNQQCRLTDVPRVTEQHNSVLHGQQNQFQQTLKCLPSTTGKVRHRKVCVPSNLSGIRSEEFPDRLNLMMRKHSDSNTANVTTASTKSPQNRGISNSPREMAASNRIPNFSSKSSYQPGSVQRNYISGQSLQTGKNRNVQQVAQTSLGKATVTTASCAKDLKPGDRVKSQPIWCPPNTIPGHAKYINHSDDPIAIDDDEEEEVSNVDRTLQQNEVDVILIDEETDTKDESNKKNLKTNNTPDTQNAAVPLHKHNNRVNEIQEQQEKDVILIDEETDDIDTKNENCVTADDIVNVQNITVSNSTEAGSEWLKFETDARPRYTYVVDKHIDLDAVSPQIVSTAPHTVSNTQVISNNPQNMSTIKQTVILNAKKGRKDVEYAAEDAPLHPSVKKIKGHVNTQAAEENISPRESSASESVLKSDSDCTSEIVLLEAFSLQPELNTSANNPLENLEQIAMTNKSCSQNSLLELSDSAFFRCGQKDCTFSTVMPVEFEVHQLQFHADVTQFICVHCGYIASTAGYLIQHLHSHVVNKMEVLPGYCNYPNCSFRIITYNDLLFHITQKHCRQSSNICLLCKQEFSTCLGLINHLKENKFTVVKCSHCSAKDVTKVSILRHIAQNHSGCSKNVLIYQSILCSERKKHNWPKNFEEKKSDAVSTSSFHSSLWSLSLEKQQQLKNELQCGGLNLVASDISGVMYPLETVKPQSVNQNLETVELCGSVGVTNSLKTAELSESGRVRDSLETVELCESGGVTHSLVTAELSESGKQSGKEDHTSKAILVEGDVGRVQAAASEIKFKQCSVDNSKSEEHLSKTTSLPEKQSEPDSEVPGKGRKKRMLKCKECGLVSSHCGYMYKHIRCKHHITDMVICEVCKISLSTNKIMGHHIQYHNDGDEDYIPTALSDAFEIFFEQPAVKDIVNKKRFKKSSFRKKPVLERNIVEKITENANEYIDYHESIDGDNIDSGELASAQQSDSNKGPNEVENKTDVVGDKMVKENNRKRKEKFNSKKKDEKIRYSVRGPDGKFRSRAKKIKLQEKRIICSKKTTTGLEEENSFGMKNMSEVQDDISVQVEKSNTNLKLTDKFDELETSKDEQDNIKKKMRNFNFSKKTSDADFSSVNSKSKKCKLQKKRSNKNTIRSNEDKSVSVNKKLKELVKHDSSKQIPVEIKKNITELKTEEDMLFDHVNAVDIPPAGLEKKMRLEKEADIPMKHETNVTLEEVKPQKYNEENKISIENEKSSSIQDDEISPSYRKLRKHTRREEIASIVKNVPVSLKGKQIVSKQKENPNRKLIVHASDDADVQKDTSFEIKEISKEPNLGMEYDQTGECSVQADNTDENATNVVSHDSKCLSSENGNPVRCLRKTHYTQEYYKENVSRGKQKSVAFIDIKKEKATKLSNHKSMQNKITGDLRETEINTDEKIVAHSDKACNLEKDIPSECTASNAEDKSVSLKEESLHLQQRSHVLGNKHLVVRLRKTNIRIPFPIECINKLEAARKESSSPPTPVEIRKCVGIKEEDCPDALQFLHPDFEFRCKYCTHRGGTFDKFIHHLYYHFHYRKYSCSYCSFQGFSESRILSHISVEHPKLKNKPTVIIKDDSQREKKFLDLCHFCFVPKSKDDAELRERLLRKKLRLANKIRIKQEFKKKVGARKVSQKTKIGGKDSILKKVAKLTKHLSKGNKQSAGKKEGYMCPYCRENRPLMSWLQLHIEICYHIHYKPLCCGYCSELQTASMLRLTKHSIKEHPGKKVKCIKQVDKVKEEKLKALADRSVNLSKRYNRAKSGHPPAKSSVNEIRKYVGWRVLRYSKIDFKPAEVNCVKTLKKSIKSANKEPVSKDISDPVLTKIKVEQQSSSNLETLSVSSVTANPASPDVQTLNEYRIYKSQELFRTEKDSYGDPVYQCIKCEYTIRNLKSMYTHSYHHQPQIFKCGYCDFRSYPRSMVVWHMKTVHHGKFKKVIDLRQKAEDEPIKSTVASKKPVIQHKPKKSPNTSYEKQVICYELQKITDSKLMDDSGVEKLLKIPDNKPALQDECDKSHSEAGNNVDLMNSNSHQK